MAAIYTEFVKAKEAPSVEGLVFLDGRLREYVRKRHAPYDTLRSEIDPALPLVDDASLHKREYQEMGLIIGHFSEWFEYTGKLLDDAHKLNSNSSLWSYTLYSEVVIPRENAKQEIEVADKYLTEFPRGPFAVQPMNDSPIISKTFMLSYETVLYRGSLVWSSTDPSWILAQNWIK